MANFEPLNSVKKITINVKNNNDLKQKRDVLIRFKPILTLLFICGFNFRVFNLCNNFKILSSIYSTSLIILVTVATVACCAEHNAFQVWSTIEYVFSVAILIFYNSKLSKFSFKLNEIDTYLRVNLKHYSMAKKRTFIITLSLCLIRLSFTVTHCFSYVCYSHIVFFMISQFASFALDINRVWRFVLLETVRYRLCFLRKRLEEMPECNYYMYVDENKTFRKNKMSFCVNLYRSIADIYDLVAPEIHISVSILVEIIFAKIRNRFILLKLVTCFISDVYNSCMYGTETDYKLIPHFVSSRWQSKLLFF